MREIAVTSTTSGIGKTVISTILGIGLKRYYRNVALFSLTTIGVVDGIKRVRIGKADLDIYKKDNLLILSKPLPPNYEEFISIIHEVRKYCLSLGVSVLIMDIPINVSYAKYVAKGADVIVLVYTDFDFHLIRTLIDKMARLTPHLVLVKNYADESRITTRDEGNYVYALFDAPFIYELAETGDLIGLLKRITHRVLKRFMPIIELINRWCPQ